MHRFKRLLGLSGLTCLLAALAFVAPVQANVKLACLTGGEAKIMEKDGQRDYLPLTGGYGSFTFNTLVFMCAGVDTKDKSDFPVKVFSGGIVVTGKFVNTVCGTGTAHSEVIDFLGGPYKLRALVGRKLTIELLGFHGPMYWHDGYKGIGSELFDPIDNNDPGKPNPNGAKDYFPMGWVTLGLSQSKSSFFLPDPFTNRCTKAFSVHGVFLIDEDGM